MRPEPSQPTPAPRARNPGTIPTSRKILYATFVLFCVFGIPELLLRAFWTPPPPSARAVGTRRFVTWLSDLALGRDRTEELYVEDRRLLWRLRPGVRLEGVNQHRLRQGEAQRVRITVNEDGHRGARVAPDKARATDLRVLCLGDSNFFGYPLDDDDTFPHVLAGSLRRGSPESTAIEVVNAGVPGYSVLQGWRLYEQRFTGYDYDWLLLSFLNNDAWLQPQSDREAFAAAVSIWAPLARAGGRVRLVRWARSRLVSEPDREDYVPRVSLPDYVRTYERFLDAAGSKGARVMVLDYRAYPQYETYSQALRELATARGVEYFPVAAAARAAFLDGRAILRYPERSARVRRRWGPMLEQNPYLWYYAEVRPEHLNEIGVAWLAAELAPRLLSGPAVPRPQ